MKKRPTGFWFFVGMWVVIACFLGYYAWEGNWQTFWLMLAFFAGWSVLVVRFSFRWF